MFNGVVILVPYWYSRGGGNGKASYLFFSNMRNSSHTRSSSTPMKLHTHRGGSCSCIVLALRIKRARFFLFCLSLPLLCLESSVSSVYGAVATPSELTIVTDLVRRGPLRGVLDDRTKRESLTPEIRHKIIKVHFQGSSCCQQNLTLPNQHMLEKNPQNRTSTDW